MEFAETYLGRLRQLVGSRLLLVVGGRAVIENSGGEILQHRLLFELRGHSDSGVSSITFSPGFERLLTGGGDATARVWDAQTGALLKVLSGHANKVATAQFDPSGKFAATGSEDKTVNIWNAETGELLATLNDSAGPVVSAAFGTSGGLRLVTVGGGKTVRIWNLRFENRTPAELDEKVGRILPYRFYDGRPLPIIERRHARWPYFVATGTGEEPTARE